jgi:hypothetical protein
MGAEPRYVFSFIVAESGNPHINPVPAKRLQVNRDLGMLKDVWARIWSAKPS